MKWILILFAVIFSSCSIWEDEKEISQPFAVESITVNNVSRTGISLTAYNSCGSMCWKRTFVESRVNGFEVFVKTVAVFNEYTACPAVCVGTETPVFIKISSNGTYNFHFWQSDTTTLDTIITVN